MEITCRQLERLTILDLTGRCLVSPGETEVAELRAIVTRLIAEGEVHVAVNLAPLQSVDARGLGEFVFTERTLRAAGGDLTLVAPNAGIRRMLAVTRLDTCLRVCDSLTEIGRGPRDTGGRETSQGGGHARTDRYGCRGMDAAADAATGRVNRSGTSRHSM